MSKRFWLAIVAGALTLLVATPAQAAAEDKLVTAKRLTTVRIDGRLVALRALNLAVTNARAITDGHQKTLTDLIAADISGLTALRTKVAGETTAQAVRDDAKQMVNDYRVYMLVSPKVRLVIAADSAAAAADRLSGLATRLGGALDKAEAGGADTAAARAKLDDLLAKVSQAKAALTGPADAALAIQAGPDAQAIQNALKPVRDGVRAAREDLRVAVADAKAIRDFLRSLVTK